MVNWVIDTPTAVGGQPITETSTTQRHPAGKIVAGHDADGTEGGAEFIYLKGVGSTIVGSIVNYNTLAFQTALGYIGENRASAMAIAMSANVANQWGWYQISGVAIAAKASTVCLVAGFAVGVGSTSGLAIATLSGQELQGAVVAVTASAAAGRTTVKLMVNRPHNQGRVT
jgi:hypothetical protein